MTGGDSGEYDISIASAKNVMADLDKDKYNVYLIIVKQGKWTFKSDNIAIEVDKTDFSLDLGNGKIHFDAAFIIIHGTPGENGLLQGYFDMMGIAYTGCSALVSTTTFDKAVCNEVVRSFQIVDVAKNITLFKKNIRSLPSVKDTIGYPVFVKPSQGGSSLATFKVNNDAELANAVAEACKVDSKVLVEQFIKGRELTCGVFNGMAFPVTEIKPDRDFFDYQAKYEGLSKEITPAHIDETLRQRVQAIAKDIYLRLGCRGVCRVDFIYNEDNDRLFFLEINTVPGQSPQSIVPQQVRAMNKTTQWLYNAVLEECF